MVATYTSYPTFKGQEIARPQSVYWNQKSKSLTLSSHWPELGHMATPTAKDPEKTEWRLGG